MGGVESKVEVKRLGAVILLDQLHRVVAEEGGRIPFLADRLVVAIPVEHVMLLVGEIINLPDQRAVLVIEPALPGPVFAVGVSEMPFPDDGGMVAGLLEGLGQEPLVRGNPGGVGGEDHGGLQAVSERIPARHQASAGRGAHRLDVELLQAGSGFRELVDVRGLDVRSVEADIFPSEVIGHDVKDVGLGGFGSRSGRGASCQEGSGGKQGGQVAECQFHRSQVVLENGVICRAPSSLQGIAAIARRMAPIQY